MPDMKRPAAQLIVGDVHYADNGKPRTVTDLTTDGDAVTIAFDDGTSQTVTPDLPLRIRRPRTPERGT
ncbi:hypothetical protein ACFPM7_29660 [Actinokineospora guangxiensis]|uniref:DUF1918 domain-containing protein n=1 Tax=Actinokineospora guangxiensis TaxID=1490288 RepID=A0ABW0EX22_9PSEU